MCIQKSHIESFKSDIYSNHEDNNNRLFVLIVFHLSSLSLLSMNMQLAPLSLRIFLYELILTLLTSEGMAVVKIEVSVLDIFLIAFIATLTTFEFRLVFVNETI